MMLCSILQTLTIYSVAYWGLITSLRRTESVFLVMVDNNNSSKRAHSVTIIDVAREAGVSYATVSRVLSGYEFVKESTRRRVNEAVERLGYVANLPARS